MFASNTSQVSEDANYIESCFSTYLYTGNGSTQTITNGIDLAGKGGLVWVKKRIAAASHGLYDTTRGAGQLLITDNTNAQATYNGVNGFSASGFSLGSGNEFNQNTQTFVSWTFRKQPKFFDIVTYTGTGSVQNVAHNLGSVPGCVIVKSTSDTGGWSVYHRGLYPPAATDGTTAPQNYVLLNSTAQVSSLSTVWNNTSPTSTQFTVGTNAAVNTSGQSYVAYIFAHNAGGFGLTGTDNVITCGQYQGLGSGTGPVIDLGFEPQWLLVKAVKDSSTSPNWYVIDNMRSWTAEGSVKDLSPNTSTAETSSGSIKLTATGFQPMGNDSSIYNERLVGYIYIAIRRGPMKVPTSGTSVFSPVAAAFNSTTVNNNGFVTDMVITRQNRAAATDYQYLTDRLRGANNSTGQYVLETDGTYAEAASSGRVALTGTQTIQTGFLYQTTTTNSIAWTFGRAPSFFDEVCYTGNGTNGRAVTHNLGVAPEMIIVKKRTGADGWVVWASGLTSRLYELYLNDPRAQFVEVSPRLNVNNAPTSTQFEVGTDGEVNASGATYVSYLFATCAGVSKVGSYTGNGTTQTINCGFTGGARFVLIKRTDSTGDWYVYDTARGMTTLTDPYLLLNSTAAESATLGSVTTVSTGFAVNASILAAINTNAASYIFLAIA